jgi:Na+-transporting methylmalonyl-CoA/oxaloacetate decarboxylase gamma subunit
MNFKRWIRHPNALKQCFVMLVLGLALVFFVNNSIFKALGFVVANLSLLLIVFSAAELEQLFWRSELEWWDEDDTRLTDWQRGL